MSAELPKQMIIFLLDNEAFALDVTIVQEILPKQLHVKFLVRPLIFQVFLIFEADYSLLSLRELLTLPQKLKLKMSLSSNTKTNCWGWQLTEYWKF